MNPHTHCASAPPSTYQGESSQGQESEPRDSEMVRTRVRKEKEVTDLYQPPHPRWIPSPPPTPKNQSSAFWLLLWWRSRWVKTAISAFRGEATSQMLCLLTQPLVVALCTRKWKKYPFGFPQLAAENSRRWPAVSTRYGPDYCRAVPKWTPPVQPAPRTPRHRRHTQPRTTQTDPKQTDLPSQKVLMCSCCFAICVHTGCLWVFIVGMHYVLRGKKKTASYHVKTEAALSENSVCFPLASGLRM